MQWGCSTHYISGFQRSSWDIKAHPKWLHSQEVTGSKRNLWWRSSEYWPPFFFFGKACSWLGGDKNESSGELEKSWVLIWEVKQLHTYVCTCVCVCVLSRIWLFETPWTVAHQAPLSMRILQARILVWVAIFPSPGDLLNPATEPQSPALASGFFNCWLNYLGSPTCT